MSANNSRRSRTIANAHIYHVAAAVKHRARELDGFSDEMPPRPKVGFSWVSAGRRRTSMSNTYAMVCSLCSVCIKHINTNARKHTHTHTLSLCMLHTCRSAVARGRRAVKHIRIYVPRHLTHMKKYERFFLALW